MNKKFFHMLRGLTISIVLKAVCVVPSYSAASSDDGLCHLLKSSETGTSRCYYYDRKKSKISFKKDLVYSAERYDSLGDSIDKDLDLVTPRTSRYSSFYSWRMNFLTVILAATGSKETPDETFHDRQYGHLCIGGDNVYFVSETDDSKKVVFCSSGTSARKNTNREKYVRVEEDKINKKLLHDGNKSHTEPYALSRLVELDKDVFKSLLRKGYKLDYYEVHFIGSHDACTDCSGDIYKGMSLIKERFGENLFMFYHGIAGYGGPQCYKIKHVATKETVEGRPYWGYFQLPNNTNRKKDWFLQTKLWSSFSSNPPSYYFATLKDLDDCLEASEIKESKGYTIGCFPELASSLEEDLEKLGIKE